MAELYPNPALVPSLRGFPVKAPVSPTSVKVERLQDIIKITWDKASNSSGDIHDAKYHLIYKFVKGKKPNFTLGSAIVALTGEDSYLLNSSLKEEYDYYVAALDRLFNESKPVKAIKIKL